ncbi:hypothetical protein DE146DRAFT_288041 [Phaeosphaeria sp. MPI-PUGE-AT-0046c]|nr:hypothetical protein DE146DRAFT_288041 [Phaeosphaeria sp. MPI-PUGE-AT-0046c]
MKFSLILSIATLASTTTASPLSTSFDKRQSTSWTYTCSSGAPPAKFTAFNLPSCTAQLTFTKDRYIGVQWNFEATYADGSRVERKPFKSANFGASDTFYPYPGNNFLTSYPGNSAFTAVHEFGNVCKGGQAPVSWRFFTSSANSACSAASYRFTTGQIRTVDGESRPAKVSGVALRRVNDAGDFQASWNAVSSAAAYSVIVRYPTGTDDIGNPYTNMRGARVQGRTTQTIATTSRRPDVDREVIVHAVNAQGVWSLTTDVQPVAARW